MKKCEVIAIANQKGGVEKTTTTFNLGVALAQNGKKVLLIDADPQGDLTTCMGWYNTDNLVTIADLMNCYIQDKKINSKDSILHHKENVDLIPSNLDLSVLEMSLMNTMSREYALKNCINPLKQDYDYILIDCMPSLGMLTVNALACADSLIIPVQSHFLSTKDTGHLLKIVSKVKNQLNPNLHLGGILLTLVDNRTNFSKGNISLVQETYSDIVKIYQNKIPNGIRVAESTFFGKSIFSYDKNSKVALAYSNFAKEVLKDGKNKIKNGITKDDAR